MKLDLKPNLLYLEEILLSRLDPRPPSSLTVFPARTLERKTEQRVSAALHQLVGELKHLSKYSVSLA